MPEFRIEWEGTPHLPPVIQVPLKADNREDALEEWRAWKDERAGHYLGGHVLKEVKTIARV